MRGPLQSLQPTAATPLVYRTNMCLGDHCVNPSRQPAVTHPSAATESRQSPAKAAPTFRRCSAPRQWI